MADKENDKTEFITVDKHTESLLYGASVEQKILKHDADAYAVVKVYNDGVAPDRIKVAGTEFISKRDLIIERINYLFWGMCLAVSVGVSTYVGITYDSTVECSERYKPILNEAICASQDLILGHE